MKCARVIAKPVGVITDFVTMQENAISIHKITRVQQWKLLFWSIKATTAAGRGHQCSLFYIQGINAGFWHKDKCHSAESQA